MEKIAVSEFRANLVGFLRKVERGQILTLTSRGHEVAKIIPPDNKMEQARAALDSLGKTAAIHDVLSPVDVEWKATK